MFYLFFSDLVREYHISSILTGNKEDRFALTESVISKENELELVCLPHGLEYGYILPSGVAGDVFFCTSVRALDKMTSYYGKGRFIFDKNLWSSVFDVKINNEHTNSNRKIVFFTEPNDIDLNRDVLLYLLEGTLDFYVKLHPRDKKYNYHDLDLKYIEDYSIAISGSVCLARKSTILIEAGFNNSKAIAIAVDTRDSLYIEEVFPSLSSDEIYVCRNFENLFEVIDKCLVI
jgi:hypothetical protein